MLVLLFALALANVYQAEVLRVIDGDTIDVRLQYRPRLYEQMTLRVIGLDTPEIRGKCPEEKRRALEAKAFLAALLPSGSMVYVHKLKHDKYGGRFNADVQTSEGKNLAELLIAADHARHYDGKMRLSWCDVNPAP